MENTLKIELAEVIKHYNALGWSPATSTNYSFKDEQGNINVSKSGIDKSQFKPTDFIIVDNQGIPTEKVNPPVPSAETLIHCILYQLFPETKVILHSHGPYPVCLSKKLDNAVSFNGYEIQKGFNGVQTHDCEVKIPIFENSQDMGFFEISLHERKNELKYHCFIIKGHGTYAWGTNLFEAKRHLETLDYLCHCEWMNFNK
jgi:methylthioribulose-1-phosphate dehydratase